VIGILGGVFDPPHNGHVELARAAKERFDLDRLIVLVAVDPGHKLVKTPAELRFALAKAAFPDDEVVLDENAFTVDAVAGGRFEDGIFLVGADEFADFPSWKNPEGVLREVRLGVATRPGYQREHLQPVLERLARPERVSFFEIPPHPIASRDVRRRVAEGQPVAGLVPPHVRRLIEELGLYQADGTAGYTEGAAKRI
jgi:nicotinate-nucleotide adenylyltransferase